MAAEPSDGLYRVVVNDEDQYSLSPSHRPLPGGWRETGFAGSRQDCLDHIEMVWTDLRPASLRKFLGQRRL